MTQNSLNDDPSGATGFTVQRRLVLAWLALAWERLWVRLWVIGLLLGIFAIFVLLDVLPQLNWMVHTGVVLAAAAGIGFTVWQRLRGFSWPSREEARARLETTSPVEHRPLTTVEDTLVAGASAIQQWMWRLHQARAHADLDRLRVKAPSPGIASRDRFAVRSAVILALFVAVIGAWSDIGNRIGRGILPMLSSDVSKAAVKLWVTPPEYTRISPIYLESPTPEGTTPPSEIEVPAGSKVLTIVTGTGRDTALTFGSVSKPLEKLADESQRGEADIVDTDSIALKQGPRTIAEWNVKFVPDAPPSVSMSGPPGEAARWKTRIDYIVRDDYGAEKVTARITRADDAKTPPLTFDVELPPNASNIFAHSSLHDLAGHIWAGDEVKIELFATDFAKQTGTSAPMTATLPLRTFKHPASRELARWRKELYYKPDATAPQVLNSVKQVLSQPDVYGKEPLVTLALETAKYRLANDPPAQSAAMVSQLLWHTAVRIEDGKLMTAEQRLAAAQKALREAVARGASPEEIKARLDDLEDALAEYQNALDDGGKEREGFSTNAEKEELKKAMEDVKKMAELGSSDATKDALKKLEDKLNDMRNGGNSDSDNPEVKKAEEMLNKMQKLAEDQSKLLDKNFEKQKEEAAKKGENEQGSGSQGGPPSADKNQQKGATQAADPNQANAQASAASSQEDLRNQLNQAMSELEDMTGDTPQSLKDAEKAMRDSRDALKMGKWQEGADGQGLATQKLNDGIKEARMQIMQKLLDKGLGGTLTPQQAAIRYSPLGARDGRRGGEQVDIPTEPDTEGMAQRVRVILDEIRKRSSDLTRPEAEQDYLRRLKKQF